MPARAITEPVSAGDGTLKASLRRVRRVSRNQSPSLGSQTLLSSDTESKSSTRICGCHLIRVPECLQMSVHGDAWVNAGKQNPKSKPLI